MHVRLQELLQRPLAPVYLVIGARVLVDRALAEVERRVLPSCEPASFNVLRWRCGDGDGGGVLAAAATLPMMADRRMIRVDALQDASESWLAGLLELVAKPSPSTVLLLGADRMPKTVKGGRAWSTVLPKAVEASGALLRFTDDDADPVRFVMAEVRAAGGAIEQAAARLVVELTGVDLQRLMREVEKLMLAGDGGTIDASVVAAQCASVAEAEVWGLTHGIAGCRTDQALTALQRLLADGEAPHKLLALVLWQLRQLLRMGELVRAGASDEEIRGALRMRGDQVSALRQQLLRAPPSAAALLAQVARANRAMNRVRAGDDRVFELLVLQLCQRG